MTTKKLKAFFHDPVDKAFNIQKHKEKALEYFSLTEINENLFTPEVKDSDYISAAADRVNFPQGFSVDFNKQAELTHPLGSGNIKMRDYGYVNPNYTEIEKVVSETITEIKKESQDNEKLLLLNLWCNIPDKFKDYELENFKLGNLWNLLPADTRIPDHSILDHNWLASAIAGSLPNPAFLKFSIGPVQSFITTAKRTEDYWAGSYILSYLSSKAIEVIIDEAGPEHIIFPYIKGQPLIDRFLEKKYFTISQSDSKNIASSRLHATKDNIKIPSLSNVIFAILPSEKAKQIAEKTKDNVQDAFISLANYIKQQFADFSSNKAEQPKVEQASCLFNTLDKIEEIFHNQIKDFIQVFYSIYKWPDSIEMLKNHHKQIFGAEPSVTASKYSSNLGNFWQSMYKIADTAFNSRKNLRNFNQQTVGEELAKCSLCGEREALHTEKETTSKDLTEFWKEIAKKEPEKLDVNGRDKLCAICFTKRMAGEYYFRKEVFEDNDKINYPSTPTIAALPFKLTLIKNYNIIGAIPNIDNYNRLLKNLNIQGNFNWRDIKYIRNLMKKSFDKNSNAYKVFDDFLSFDSQWIYEESFTKDFLSDSGIDYSANKDTIDEIKKILKKICEVVNAHPSKYFAVLSMDGDKMGQWLSGTHPNWPLWKDVVHSDAIANFPEDIKNKKRNLSPAVHSFISKSLNSFSLKLVKDVVESDFPGKLIYSGGDDVLAFLPIESVLDAAEKLRFTFSGNLSENREIDLSHTNGYIVVEEKDSKKIISTLGNKTSMSAGIVIAHKKEDLTEVLKTARTIEKEAKEAYDRDAFVLKIIKHSGNNLQYGSKWKDEDNRIVEKLNILLKNIATDEGKDGLSMSFFQSMFTDINKLPSASHNIIKSLLNLKLKRHLHLNKNKDETLDEFKERKKQIHEKIYNLFTFFIEKPNSKDKDFESLLLILRFLSTGGRK